MGAHRRHVPHIEEFPQRGHGKIGCLAQQQSRYADGACRSAQRRDRDGHVKLPYQFFQYEDRACDWRIECRGQSCSRSSCQQYATVIVISPENSSHHVADDRADLHRGTFATERQPSSDRHQPAQKLHPHNMKRIADPAFAQLRFHVRNSAAGRFRR